MTGEKNRGFRSKYGSKVTSKHDQMAIEFFRCKGIRRYIGHGEDEHPMHIEMEVPINDQRGYTVGFWDCVIYVDRGTYEEKHCFELKPYLKTMGETLRQLQLYRQFPVRGHFHHLASLPTKTYLWTRDPRYAELFEGHGIKVLVKKEDVARAIELHLDEVIAEEEEDKGEE